MPEKPPWEEPSESMDRWIAIRWVAYACRVTDDEVRAWDLSNRQLKELGYRLSTNRLLNPPRERQVKVHQFVCKKCGRDASRPYRTKRPTLCGRCAR